MMAQNLWLVVLVESGETTEIEAFADKAKAFAKSTTIRNEIDPGYDSVNVFELNLPEHFDDGWVTELTQYE